MSHRTPIDALIAAGRLFGAQLPVLLPAVLLLQAVKAGVLLAAIAALGDDAGSMVGALVAAMLLAAVTGLGALVAIDDHDGHRFSGPADLLVSARPFVLAFALGGAVLALLAAPALLFGVAAAFLTPWMLSMRRGETPGLSARDSARRAAELGRSAIVPTVLLLAFYKFAVYLIPALADSLVGRKAPLPLWVPVESLISSFVTPLIAMAVVIWYLELDARLRAAPAPAPQPAGAFVPGFGAPTFVKPGAAR